MTSSFDAISGIKIISGNPTEAEIAAIVSAWASIMSASGDNSVDKDVDQLAKWAFSRRFSSSPGTLKAALPADMKSWTTASRLNARR